MKKRIGVNIDGILRNYLDRFEKVYISTYIYNPSIVEANEEMTEIKFLSEEEEIERDKKTQTTIAEKIHKPIDSHDLLNHFHFDPGVDFGGDEIDARGKMEEFMYELKAYNIFAQAEAYTGAIDSLHKLQIIGEKEGFDVVLFSTLKNKAITATYSFLSAVACRARNIMFLKNDFEKWDHCDVLFDVVPEAFQSKPEGKIVIKIENEANQWDESDFSYKSLKDAVKDQELISKISK
jgi:hypothetical protein